MYKETADQASPFTVPQEGEDPEEQGLRILAKIIARRLARSRAHRNAMLDEQRGHDPATVIEEALSDSPEQESLIGGSRISEVERSG